MEVSQIDLGEMKFLLTLRAIVIFFSPNYVLTGFENREDERKNK